MSRRRPAAGDETQEQPDPLADARQIIDRLLGVET